MNWLGRAGRGNREETLEQMEHEALDAGLRQALNDFKGSVHAWSDAEYARPRAVQVVRHRVGRRALAWTLAGLLLASGTGGALHMAHERQVAAEAAAARAAEQERARAAELARQKQLREEQLLASVDSAVSRTVPSAMDPFVDLVEDGESNQ